MRAALKVEHGCRQERQAPESLRRQRQLPDAGADRAYVAANGWCENPCIAPPGWQGKRRWR